MTEIDLNAWAATVAAELGITPAVEIDVDQILDLASVAAHNVIRPAAPLTTFLAGLAAGRAGGSTEDIVRALQSASDLCNRVGDIQ